MPNNQNQTEFSLADLYKSPVQQQPDLGSQPPAITGGGSINPQKSENGAGVAPAETAHQEAAPTNEIYTSPEIYKTPEINIPIQNKQSISQNNPQDTQEVITITTKSQDVVDKRDQKVKLKKIENTPDKLTSIADQEEEEFIEKVEAAHEHR